MDNFDKLFRQWAKDEKEKLSRKIVGKEEAKAKRTYIHFDKRSDASLILYKSKFRPMEIARHAFWPFLKISLKTIKIKNKKKRKKEIKVRDVYYAAHRDALIYSWYSFLLNKLYVNKIKQIGIDENAIAYRKVPRQDNPKRNKCNVHFANEVFSFIKENNEECVAFVSDITGFFDNLDHEHLKTEWKRLLDLPTISELPADHLVIYNNLTKFKYVEADKVYQLFGIKFKKKKYRDKFGKIKVYAVPQRDDKTIENILKGPHYRKEFQEFVVNRGLIKGNENWNYCKRCSRGIMQGAPISATLSNVYMMSFDEEIRKITNERGGLYRRYSDDLVIVCRLGDYEFLRNSVINGIQKYFLEIKEEKTKPTFFLRNNLGLLSGYQSSEKKKLQSMQYLGFDFNGQQVFIRCNSLAKYYRRMKSCVRKAVSMAYGKKTKTKVNNKIFKRRLYKKYLYKGRRSFISYALRANEVIGGDTIRKQLSKRFSIMHEYVDKKETKRLKK